MKKFLIIISLLFPLASFAYDGLAPGDRDCPGGCTYSRTDIFSFVEKRLEGNKDKEAILATIKCESDFDHKAVGDKGDSLGLVQINLPSWPQISRQEAFDPTFAMDFIIEQFRLGHQKFWTCYRIFAKKNAILG